MTNTEGQKKADQYDAKSSKKVPFSFPFHLFAVSRFDDDATRLSIGLKSF